MVESNASCNGTEGFDVQTSERWVEVLSAIWIFLIILFGVLENGVILYVFTKNKQLFVSNNIPVIAMLVNCLCMAGLGAPLPFIAEISGGFYVHLSESWCTFEAFLVYLLGMASLYILVLISIMRRATITNPLGSSRLTNKHAMIGVFTSYALAAVFALCPLFGFGSYGLEAHGTSCGLAWEDQSTSGKTYLFVILVGCFLVPVTLMVMSYSAIFKVLKKASVFPSATATSLRFRRQQDKERKLLKLSITMVVAYLICWTPYAVVSFYIGFGNPGDLHPLVTRLPALVAKSEVVWNPIIYMLQTRPFRHKIYKIVPIRCLREMLLERDNATEVQMSDMAISISKNVPATVLAGSSAQFSSTSQQKLSEDRSVVTETGFVN